MIYKWRVKYDVVLKDDRDQVVTTNVEGEVNGVNIINACERVRRDVENGEKGEKGESLSANVIFAERLA